MGKRNGFTPLETGIPNREKGRFPMGFTFIWLLVMIAIVVLLMALFLDFYALSGFFSSEDFVGFFPGFGRPLAGCLQLF